MIIRGVGAAGAGGLAGAEACICVTLLLCAGGIAAGGAFPVGAAGVITRGGTAIACGAFVGLEADGLAGGVAAGGGTGVLGGITTTEGGRKVAATEAGVTILGAGGAAAGASLAGLGGVALGALDAAGASVFTSAAGALAGGLTAVRGAGASAAPFCWVMARSTSPGREIFDRSILVLMPSSPDAKREVFAELDVDSERPRRCFRTRSAS
jgi:hypothetical protein